jgi:hypothetical protein
MEDERPKMTRAPGCARDAPPAVRVLSMRKPRGKERRAPTLIVEAEMGGMRITVAVVARLGGKVEVWLPMGEDHQPALVLPDDMNAALRDGVLAAVAASPEAMDALRRGSGRPLTFPA